MSELTELESWKADAIRLLGEKVKAEKEKDRIYAALKEYISAADETMSSSDDVSAMIRFGEADETARKIIAEIERE